MSAYKLIAALVVRNAADEYKNTLKQHHHSPENQKVVQRLKELELFFRSDWFEELSDSDGEKIMQRIQFLVRQEVHKS